MISISNIHDFALFRPVKYPCNEDKFDKFVQACGEGDIELVMYLAQDVDVHDQECQAWYMACSNGHLSVAEWIKTYYPSNSLTYRCKCAFKTACLHGHLNIVKWLITEFANIDVYGANDIAFKTACQNNHIELAKYLFEKYDVDVHADDCVAINTCASAEIATWLAQISKIMRKNISRCAVRFAEMGDLVAVQSFVFDFPDMIDARCMRRAIFCAHKSYKKDVVEWLSDNKTQILKNHRASIKY